METILEFERYLQNVKCFSNKTIEIYSKYTKKLAENDYDYKKILILINLNSNNTKRVILSAIKSYYKFINDSRFNEIQLPKKTTKALPFVTFDEYNSIKNKINIKTKKQFMKYIIIKLLFETGIRSSELLSIKKNDISNNKIIINGKGNSQRIINISSELMEELERYIKSVNGDLIFNFSYKNLYKKINEISKSKKYTPHMFRRGYAKFCYSKGVPIYDISLSMGHNDINTTAIYIKRKSEDVNVSGLFS